MESWRVAGRFALTLTLLSQTISAHAAGALAVGRCDRLGYATGYASLTAARAHALEQCAREGDQTCEVVVTIRGMCAAFAISGTCGARGWAYAPLRATAEQLALNWCIREGGTECTVQRWICDGGR